jgi:low affinity Fe/Cu permease
MQTKIEKIAEQTTKWTGSTAAFILACLSILIWLIAGPFFKYSDTWQLIANTFTTLVTFLMVFLIQRSQNKDVLALHLKLDELIRAKASADNKVILVESLSESELENLRKQYASLGEEQPARLPDDRVS